MESILGGSAWVRHPFLLIHIVSGFIGMYAGLVPLFTRKGGTAHRRWGLVFVWAIGVASITSFPLAFWSADLFQAAIGLLTGYLTLLTVRSLSGSDASRPILDWMIAVSSSAAFTFMAGAGGAQLARAPSPEAGAAVVFGLLGLLVAARNIGFLTSRLRSFRARVLDHMLASCLAMVCTVASFLNTQLGNLTGLDWPLHWRMLVPLVFAAPLLAYYLARWSRKLQGLNRTVEIEQPAERSEAARLRFFALAEGVSFLVLLFLAVPLKHFGGQADLVRIMGPVHGALIVLYVIAVFLARRPLGWSVSRVASALVAGVIPGGTIALDAYLRREEQGLRSHRGRRSPDMTNALLPE